MANTLPRVLITDNINPKAVDILNGVAEVVYEKALSNEELIQQITTFDGLMIRSASKVKDDVLNQAHQLKIVGRAGVGTDNIDLDKATEHGVIVVNSPEGNTIAASEHTVGMLMALARHIPEGDQTLKAGQWNRSQLTGVEVFGKTLGVIGLGKIGGRVAKTCLSLGMSVRVYDPYLSQARAEDLGVSLAALDEIWEHSDFITIHAPKTRETANLLNAETLKKCKPGVRLVNCARGGIINEADLADAIISGHVAGAALDVFESEPINPDNPLLTLGNKVVLTPHLGASTEEAQVNVAIDVAKQIRDFFKDGFVQSAVNIPMLRKDILDPVKHYMPMAEVLGSLVGQIAKGGIQSVEIVAKGSIHDVDTSPLTLAVLKGLLSLTREGVNYVNARLIAEERGISLKESSVKTLKSYQNMLVIHLTTDERTYTVAGTLIHGDNFRIINIDGCRLTLEHTPHLLFTPHEDKPGMVGLVSGILGNEHINISSLQVGRQGTALSADQSVETAQSLMVFNLDTPISPETLSAIQAQSGIIEALYIHL